MSSYQNLKFKFHFKSHRPFTYLTNHSEMPQSYSQSNSSDQTAHCVQSDQISCSTNIPKGYSFHPAARECVLQPNNEFKHSPQSQS